MESLLYWLRVGDGIIYLMRIVVLVNWFWSGSMAVTFGLGDITIDSIFIINAFLAYGLPFWRLCPVTCPGI